MTFELAFGFGIFALGLIGVLIAWLHPDPTAQPMMKALAWPLKNQDRLDVLLRGVFHMALGAIFLLGSTGGELLAILLVGVVLFATGVALGVRRPAA